MADKQPTGLGGSAADDDVEAYESDWYRSLKALAERQDAIEAGEGAVATAEAPAESVWATPPPADEQATEVAWTPEAAAETPVAETVEAASEIAEAGVVSSDASAEAPDVVELPEQTEAEPSGPNLMAPAAEQVAPLGSGEPQAAPVEAKGAPAEPSLTSSDVEERRAALSALSDRGLSELDVAPASALLLDPDPEIRRLALEVLVSRADHVEERLVQQALQDPADDVRAAAVGLVAARGSHGLAALAPLAGARRWPTTQSAVLRTLPQIVGSSGGLSDEDLSSILNGIASLESAPTAEEREPLSELARAIGVQRLVEHTTVPDDRRLGAVRLLAADGTTQSLRAVTALDADPIQEIRDAAQAAVARLEELERSTASFQQQPDAGEVAVHQAVQTEMITGLVRALQDPEPVVRDRAIAALNETDRGTLTEWAREALRSGDPDLTPLAAQIAEMHRLAEVAPEILDQGAAASGEARAPFAAALSAFPVDTEVLVNSLAGVEPSRRHEAIQLLWQVAGRNALPHLRQSLSDPSEAVRMAVLEVFGNSGDPSSTDVARGILGSDSSPMVRASAVRVLGAAGADQRITALGQALQDPDPMVRATAVAILPESIGREATDLLMRAVSDLDEGVRQAALRHVAGFPEEDLALVWSALASCPPVERDGLMGIMEKSDRQKLATLALQHLQAIDPSERVLAAEIAGRAATAQCVQALVVALQDPVASVRQAATAALGSARAAEAVQALGRSLNDPDPEVRIGAVRALGVIDDEQVLGFLVAALNDPEPSVKETASEVLTRWSSPAVAKRLAGVLASPALRQQATDLLTKMGGSAVELLVDVLLHSTSEIRPIVGSLLERLAGMDRFLENMASMDPQQRLRAAEAVGAIGGPRAVDAIVGTLSDPDERVRIRSLELLGDLGDQRAIDVVRKSFLGDPVPEVVDAAKKALAKLRPGETA